MACATLACSPSGAAGYIQLSFATSQNNLEKPLKRKIEKKIVLTRFDSRRKLSFEAYDKLKQQYGDDVCETRIHENVSLAESPSRGKDIFEFAAHSRGAQDYGALTMELLQKGFFE